MNKEIGGYFGIEEHLLKGGSEFYGDLISLNTGRNALAYLIKALKIKKLYIPYLLCESVSNLCLREKCDFEYFNVGENLKPVFNKKLSKNEYLYIVNYYGLLSKKEILEFKHLYKNIILDNVQAFFQKPIKGIPTIYSTRKWFGVPDGAYLSSSKKIDLNLIDDSSGRMTHLYGRKKDGATAHYEEFKNNDRSFVKLELMNMSKITKGLLSNVNYEFVSKSRKNNYCYLKKELSTYNGLNGSCFSTPFCYPFFCKNGLEIRKKLATKKIYIPTYWPNVVNQDNLEAKFANNILPLPCDQRYSLEDMKTIVSLLKEEVGLDSQTYASRNLVFRELNLRHLSYVNKCHNNEELYSTLVGSIFHPSIESDKKWIKSYLLNNENNYRGVIYDKSNHILGMVYLLDINRTKKACHIAIFISNKKYRGKGYGTEAFERTLKFANEEYGISTFFLSVLKENVRAISLYQKFGFKIDKQRVAKKDNRNVEVLDMVLSIV